MQPWYVPKTQANFSVLNEYEYFRPRTSMQVEDVKFIDWHLNCYGVSI